MRTWDGLYEKNIGCNKRIYMEVNDDVEKLSGGPQA